MRILAAILVLGLVPITASMVGCRAPWGNAASWSFATKKPSAKNLVGNYTLRPILDDAASQPKWPDALLQLESNGAAKFTRCPSYVWLGGAGAAGPDLNGDATWEVVASADGYFDVRFSLSTGEYAGKSIDLRVWHNSSPHKLWVQQGDADNGEGLLFVPAPADKATTP